MRYTTRIIGLGGAAALVLGLSACGGTDWEATATEACDAGEAVCSCMVAGIGEQYDGGEALQMLAAMALSFDESAISETDAAEELELSTADFASFRETATRTLDRLRRGCESS